MLSRIVQPSQRRGHFHRRPKFSSSKSKVVTATFKIDGESKRKYVTLCINGVPTRLQLDTASDLTLISRDTWRKFGWPPLLPTHYTARNAYGETLKLAGEVTCEVTFGDNRIKTCCFVTDHPGLDLLRLDWMDDLKLLDQPVNSICNQTKIHSRSETLLFSPGLQRQIEELKIWHASVFETGLSLCTKAKATLT
ncbi:hypothetical protein EG68_12569 [Paragonimus skrjabini miyazakii]|uniref:Peptidase A2 domain-containing protein n=1 Tax=Paragonimus skrjabini miyazakii TaxID=59628 RepID=A0A8S9YP70_9TREM|nr:hypothetical protein EG68_12569 [Paragonimus skrjabini miyazakii]